MSEQINDSKTVEEKKGIQFETMTYFSLKGDYFGATNKFSNSEESNSGEGMRTEAKTQKVREGEGK